MKDGKYDAEYHLYGDKDFNCPDHEIKGKFFVGVVLMDTTFLCMAHNSEFLPDENIVYPNKQTEWGNSSNIKFLVDAISKDNAYQDDFTINLKTTPVVCGDCWFSKCTECQKNPKRFTEYK